MNVKLNSKAPPPAFLSISSSNSTFRISFWHWVRSLTDDIARSLANWFSINGSCKFSLQWVPQCLTVSLSLARWSLPFVKSPALQILFIQSELLSVHAAAPAAATEDGDDVVSNGWWVSYSFWYLAVSTTLTLAKGRFNLNHFLSQFRIYFSWILPHRAFHPSEHTHSHAHDNDYTAPLHWHWGILGANRLFQDFHRKLIANRIYSMENYSTTWSQALGPSWHPLIRHWARQSHFFSRLLQSKAQQWRALWKFEVHFSHTFRTRRPTTPTALSAWPQDPPFKHCFTGYPTSLGSEKWCHLAHADRHKLLVWTFETNSSGKALGKFDWTWAARERDGGVIGAGALLLHRSYGWSKSVSRWWVGGGDMRRTDQRMCGVNRSGFGIGRETRSQDGCEWSS